jgi:hypothetical protein
MTRSAIGIGLGIFLFASGAAAQGDGAAMATAVRYHEAARAVEICGGKPLTGAEHDRLAMLISQATQQRLTVGESLNVVKEARFNMEQRIQASSCKDPLVVDALRFFEQVRPQLR